MRGVESGCGSPQSRKVHARLQLPLQMALEDSRELSGTTRSLMRCPRDVAHRWMGTRRGSVGSRQLAPVTMKPSGFEPSLSHTLLKRRA
jgi:hypothetical protein